MCFVLWCRVLWGGWCGEIVIDAALGSNLPGFVPYSEKEILSSFAARALSRKVEFIHAPGRLNVERRTLNASPGRRQEHQAPGNWKRLEDQVLGDRLLQGILQAKRKFILSQTLMEKSSSGTSTIVQIISSRIAFRSMNLTIKYWRVVVHDLAKIPPITKRFSAQIWNQFMSDC